MGKTNVAINRYLADNERFADLFNVVIFNGRRIVSADDLSELDTKARRAGSERDKESHEYIRDQIKQWKCGAKLLVLGVEPESSVQYALPVKLMKYESIQYEKNYREIMKKHRKDRDLSSKEFISGFSRSDRLSPMLTIVIYHGRDEWDASETLHDLLDFEGFPEAIRGEVMKYCNDFHINLLDVNHMENSDKFVTDLREVFGFLARQNDKKSLRKYVEENENFRHLKEDTYEVIMSFGNVNVEDSWIQKEKYQMKEGIDVSLAIREWREELLIEGKMTELIRLVERKQEKGLKIPEIAEMLEQDPEVIRNISQAIDESESKEPCSVYEYMSEEFVRL